MNNFFLFHNAQRVNYYHNDTIQTTLQPNEKIHVVEYYFHIFQEYNHLMKYFKITYLDNNKGYICGNYEHPEIDNSKCFTHRYSPITSPLTSDFLQEGDNYYFKITNEDYENTHDLSE